MQQYIARRLLFGLLTAILVSLMVFALMRIAPGDVAQMIALDASGVRRRQSPKRRCNRYENP